MGLERVLVRVAPRDGRGSRTIRLEGPPQQLVLLRGAGSVLDCGIAFLPEGGVLRDEAVVPRDEGGERAGGVVVVFDEQGRERDGCEGLFTFTFPFPFGRDDARRSSGRRRRHVGRVHGEGEGEPGGRDSSLVRDKSARESHSQTSKPCPRLYGAEVHGQQ